MIVVEFKCKFCGEHWTSDRWWKCCPTHTTQRGPDVVCERCYEEIHLGLPSDKSNFPPIVTNILVVILALYFFAAAFYGISMIGSPSGK